MKQIDIQNEIKNIYSLKYSLEKTLGEIENNEFISSKQRRDFEQQLLPLLNSNVDFIDILIRLINLFSKKSSLYSTPDTAKINQGLKQIRKIAEKMRRKAILSNPSNQEKLKQALKWFSVNGDHEDLVFIRKVKQDYIYTRDIISLFSITEKEIIKRSSN